MCTREQVPWEARGAGVTGSFELSNMGARNKTWVLWKSDMCALSCSPAAIFLILFMKWKDPPWTRAAPLPGLVAGLRERESRLNTSKHALTHSCLLWGCHVISSLKLLLLWFCYHDAQEPGVLSYIRPFSFKLLSLGYFSIATGKDKEQMLMSPIGNSVFTHRIHSTV